ncbi:hypothetical protein Trydic_g14359 [Trypoxylus dichotomus]
MSLNTAHINGGVLIHSGECILIFSDKVSLEWQNTADPIFKGTKKGRIYLTTHRIVFNAAHSSEKMQSFSFPFVTLSNMQLEQPVFGANYIRGTVVAQPNGNWQGTNEFKLTFKNGGAIEFGQAMLKAASLATRSYQSQGGPPPYTPPNSQWYAAPPPAYGPAPTGYYGWTPPTNTFPDHPPQNSVYMTDAPPPYPGLPASYQGQASAGAAGMTHNPAAFAKAQEAAQSAYYDPNQPQMAYVPPPAYYENPPSYDQAIHKKDQCAKSNEPSAHNFTVFQRELCDKKAMKDDILQNHNSYYSFNNETKVMTQVLGFLEISNDKSYIEASRFIHKFAKLSPYELEMKRSGPGKYDVSGLGLIKMTRRWAEDLTKSKRDLTIHPILRFPDWKAPDILALISSYSELTEFSMELVRICEENNLHGLVLDVWSGFFQKMPTSSLIFLIKEICARLRINLRQAVILVPAMYSNSDVISQEIFQILADFANYVILDVYDYSSSCRSGPNVRPVNEIEDFIKYLTPDPLVRRTSIMLGINFFGNAFTSTETRKITGNEYIELLRNYDQNELRFDEQSLEHYFELNSSNERVEIWYPTLYSLHSKVRLANKLGVGLAISKLGEGLAYFYDVL